MAAGGGQMGVLQSWMLDSCISQADAAAGNLVLSQTCDLEVLKFGASPVDPVLEIPPKSIILAAPLSFLLCSQMRR